jgi:hypothetical protein
MEKKKEKSRLTIKLKEDQPNPKTVFPDALQIIQYAFTIDDRDFFWFEDFNETPNERAFQCLNYFAELRMSCSREFLLAHVAAIKNAMNNPSGPQFTEVASLTQDLEDRLTWLTDLEIAYRLCSVVFFDQHEHPGRYESTHALANAKLFKNVGIEEFFFAQPIKRLLPHLDSLGKDLPNYFEAMTELNRLHLGRVLARLSQDDMKKEWVGFLTSALQEESTQK